MSLVPVRFFYKNHRGEVEERHVVPESIEFNLAYHGDFHPQPGWVLNGFCLDRKARRTFLLANICLPAGEVLEQFTMGQRRVEVFTSIRLDFKPEPPLQPEGLERGWASTNEERE